LNPTPKDVLKADVAARKDGSVICINSAGNRAARSAGLSLAADFERTAAAIDAVVKGATTNKAATISAFKTLGMTRRETDVLLWIARGQSNAEIGDSLCISPRTVKKHLEHIFSKLGVKTRLAAAVRASAACSARSPGAVKRFAGTSRCLPSNSGLRSALNRRNLRTTPSQLRRQP
jgi:DNA-binding CsgD family transcriptional regulator